MPQNIPFRGVHTRRCFVSTTSCHLSLVDAAIGTFPRRAHAEMFCFNDQLPSLPNGCSNRYLSEACTRGDVLFRRPAAVSPLDEGSKRCLSEAYTREGVLFQRPFLFLRHEAGGSPIDMGPVATMSIGLPPASLFVLRHWTDAWTAPHCSFCAIDGGKACSPALRPLGLRLCYMFFRGHKARSPGFPLPSPALVSAIVTMQTVRCFPLR